MIVALAVYMHGRDCVGLLLHVFADKEMCKQQNLTLVDGGDDFHIRLRRPPANAVSSADDWILVEQVLKCAFGAQTHPPPFSLSL